MITYGTQSFNLDLNAYTDPAKLHEELAEFSAQEQQLFSYYFLISQFLRFELLYPCVLDNTKTGDIRYTYYNIMRIFANERHDNFVDCSNDSNIDGTYDEYSHNYEMDLSKFYEYLQKLFGIKKLVDYLEEGIKFCKSNYFKKDPISFKMAATLLCNGQIDLDNAIVIIKSMLFAQDYFDTDALVAIRSYLIKSKNFKKKFKLCKSKDNSFESCLQLFYSDYILMGDELCFDKDFLDFSIDNNKYFLSCFEYVCYFLYIRNIYNIAIFICQTLQHIFFKGDFLEIVFSKIYHRLSFVAYNSIYSYLSEKERLYYLHSMIIDDCVLHHHSSLVFYNLEKMFKLSSRLFRKFNSHKHDNIIEEICQDAINKWKNGSELDHIEMVNTYKEDKKYKDFFNEKKFVNRLLLKIKESCKNNQIRKIRGIDVFKKSSKIDRN